MNLEEGEFNMPTDDCMNVKVNKASYAGYSLLM